VDASAPAQSGSDPEGFDAYGLVQTARKQFDKAVAWDSKNREQAREDLDFLAGNQWHTLDVNERRLARRPTLTLNRLPQFLKQVSNEVRKNRPAIKCTAADGMANPAGAQVFEGLIRAIERVSGAGRVYSRAVEQSAGCGMGHFRLALEYEDETSFDMGLRIRSIRNPFSVIWDPSAVMDDKSDAKYCFVYQELSEEEFKASYPDAALNPWATPSAASPTSAGHWRAGGKTVTVCEYWVVHEEPSTLVRVRHDREWYDQGGPQMPTGEDAILEDPSPEEMAQYQAQGFSFVAKRSAKKKRVCMYLLGGNSMLEGPVQTPFTRIPIFTVVGDETELGDETVRSSLLRHAKDAQRLLNYYASADAEMHALAPKVPFILSLRQVAGLEQFWNTANQSTRPYLPYNDHDEEGEIKAPKPSREPGIGTNPGLMAGAQAAGQYLKDTTGIYDASIGNQGNEVSGKAIEARDAQADTGTFNFVDNLANTVEAMGREMVAVIPIVYSPDRQIRILGEDDAPAIIDLAQSGVDLNVGKYDVAVKLGPAFETQRQEVISGLIDLAKNASNPAFQTLLYVEITKLQDFHGSDELAAKLEGVAQALGMLPPPPGAAPPGMGPMMGAPGGAPPMLPPPGMPGQQPQPGPPMGGPIDNIIPFPPSGAFPATGPRVAPQPMLQGARGN
jgi:hypothetical protein